MKGQVIPIGSESEEVDLSADDEELDQIEIETPGQMDPSKINEND